MKIALIIVAAGNFGIAAFLALKHREKAAFSASMNVFVGLMVLYTASTL